MAKGMNTEFMANPAGFISNRWLMVPSVIGLNNGAGTFGIYPNGNHGAIVRPFVRNSYWSHPMRAYYLKPAPNAENSHVLPNDVSYMFTDTMNGCQFLAYGPDRNNVTVEHNNYFGGTAANYVTRRNLIQGAGHAFYWEVRPNQEYNPLQGAVVIGVRSGVGWQFYLRLNANMAFNAATGPH